MALAVPKLNASQSVITGDDEVLITDCGLSISTGMFCIFFGVYSMIADPNYLYVCTFCDKKLAHAVSAVNHAASAKHIRQLDYARQEKLLESSINLNDRPYDMLDQHIIARGKSLGLTECRCLLCNVTLHDKYTLTAHMSSNKHLRNLDWYQRLHCAIALDRFQSVTDLYAPGSKALIREESYVALTPFGDFIISKEVHKFISDLPKCVSVREWDYYCRYCNNIMNNEQALENHLNSQNHRMRAQARNMYQMPNYPQPAREYKPPQEQSWQTAVRAGAVPPPPSSRPMARPTPKQ